MASSNQAKKPIHIGPIRHNLEAFGVAILAAVLLKWFCLEAYQIPTSSMQPTLMGSSEANVHDRILVDKLVQTFREPKRWDITVFKYPLQKNQNYVKRIGGMPGDRLHIEGGNVYQVEGDGASRKLTIVRKPDDLQDVMWKNVFPARMLARAETKAMGDVFAASPSRAAKETATGFTLDANGKSARLFFRDRTDGGMVNRVWDGYPADVARQIREKAVTLRPPEIVPDARMTAEVTADKVPDEFAMEIEVVRPDHDKRTYAFIVRDGKGQLIVRDKTNKQPTAASDTFDVALAAGTATELSFAHVDDMLIAWQDGTQVQAFDVASWPCAKGCVLPPSATDRNQPLPANHKVIPQFVSRGKGKLALDNVRIDRDQHYTRDSSPDVIEVPEDHYYMLGDNTLQSIDSRGWTAITIGVDKDNFVVPPDSPDSVRTIRGNKRPMNLTDEPDRDETPIAIRGAGGDSDRIVMIDEFGAILRLNARIGPNWGRGTCAFLDKDGNEWTAPDTTNTKGISFVPRSDIAGRALAVFFPSRPISWLLGSSWPDRAGFVR